MYCPSCPLLAHQADRELSRAIPGLYEGARLELAVSWSLLMAPLAMPRAAEHSEKILSKASYYMTSTVSGLDVLNPAL